MSGLGARGKEKAKGPSGVADLFQRTELNDANTQKHSYTEEQSKEQSPVRKQFQFSADLAERLRVYAFHNRMKEVDVVREALEVFFENK